MNNNSFSPEKTLSVLTTLYFFTGYLFLQQSASPLWLHLFGALIMSVSIGYSVNMWLIPKCYSLLQSRLGNNVSGYMLYIVPSVLFFFYYLWFFTAGVTSWKLTLYSPENAVMFLFAAVQSYVVLIVNDKQQKKLPRPRIPKELSQALVFGFITLIIFRIFSGFTGNSGISPPYSLPGLVISQQEDRRFVILELDGISLKTLVNSSMEGKLPNLTRITGQSTVGIVKGTADRRSLLDIINHMPVEVQFPTGREGIDHLKHFGIFELLKSFVFINNSARIKPFMIRKYDREPFWNSAERFNITTGLINTPFSQQSTQGFYISDRFFETSSASGTVFPKDLEKITETVTLADLNPRISAISDRYEQFIHYSENVAAYCGGMYERYRPEVFLTMLSSAGKDISESDAAIIFDAFAGAIFNKTSESHTHFIVIGSAQDTGEDSFVLYNIPERQLGEKSRTIEREFIENDILYLLGIPILEKQDGKINYNLFHKAHLAAVNSGITRYYPSYFGN